MLLWYTSQISTIWKHSYKGVEWKPYVNKSTGGRYFIVFSNVFINLLACSKL